MEADSNTSAGQPDSQGAVAERAPMRAPTKVDQLPPFRVLLHNDDVNTMEHVARSLMELVALGPERAVEVTLEAHKAGVALVQVCHKELAELRVEQLRSKSLTATMEPAV